MASAQLTVDVLRLKKLFQDEDNALTTSPCVEVTVRHAMVPEIARSKADDDEAELPADPIEVARLADLSKQTRAAREEASPFLNESMTFDLTAIFNATAYGVRLRKEPAKPEQANTTGLGRPPRDWVAEIRAARLGNAPSAAAGDTGDGDSPNDESAPEAEPKFEILFRALDTNKHPYAFVAEASVGDVMLTENGKGDATLTLRRDDQSDVDCGTLTVRYSVKVTLPEGPVVDPDADITLPYKPKLTGEYELVPTERRNVWWHLANDHSWRDRVTKAIIAANPVEKSATGGTKGGGRGGKAPLGQSTRSEGGGSELNSTGVALAAVIQHKWKCKRLHQFFTKFRFSCERQMAGTPLVWTPDEELQQKALWVDSAAVRRQVMLSKPALQKRVPNALESLYTYYLTGERQEPGTRPTDHQLSKRNTASFGRAEYEAMVAAMIEMSEPRLAGTPIVTVIAKETYDADPTMPGTKAHKAAAAEAAKREEEERKAEEERAAEALALAQSMAASSRKDKSAPPPPEEKPKPQPPARKRPGQAAEEAFMGLIRGYADWWAETYTEHEYAMVVESLEPVVALAREKAAAANPGLASLMPTRPGSGKRRGSSAKKGRKKSVAK